MGIFRPFAKLANTLRRWAKFSRLSHSRVATTSGDSTPTQECQTADGQYFLDMVDGARLSYHIRGSEHLDEATPIVIVLGMSAIVSDIERLTDALVESHTVLIHDHRGMGMSKLTEVGDEDLSIELMARDLLALLEHVGWKKVALVGWSMGGVIAQQLLTLPFHEERPTPLPFTVSHVILAATRSKVHVGTGLKLGPAPENPTLEERKAITRRVVFALLDRTFIEQNPDRVEVLVQRSIDGLSVRPAAILAKQGAALLKFKFDHLLDKVSRDVPILVVHGNSDSVIPFHCGEEILRSIPWATMLQAGDKPGQVPTMTFGHYWYEYFDVKVWHDVVHTFVSPAS